MPPTLIPPGAGRFVVGISGASGAAYARRCISTLVELRHEVHIVVSGYGKRLLHDELGLEVLSKATSHALTGLPEGDDPAAHRVFLHPTKDVGASLGSGSFRHDGMTILPCSSKTLGAIASGLGESLLTRAAAVCLKERFPLVVCHREAPLNRIDIENMLRLHDAGACICPTNPGFYTDPRSIDDIVDFVVARVLDQLRVEHTVGTRWHEHTARRDGTDRGDAVATDG